MTMRDIASFGAWVWMAAPLAAIAQPVPVPTLTVSRLAEGELTCPPDPLRG
jgi:hypothetical protein